MSVVLAEGFAEPFDADGESYAAFGRRVPALRSFYLGYDVGSAHPGDHDLVMVQVLAGGFSEDLTPAAAMARANVPDGRLQVALQDANPEGTDFFYRVSHTAVSLPGSRRYQMREVGVVDQDIQPLPAAIFPDAVPNPARPDPIVALSGFKLFFDGNRNHEIDRIGVWIVGRDLHVAMRDANGNDTFSYLVDFVVIPRIQLNAAFHRVRGTGRGGGQIRMTPPPRSMCLLTGWAFNYQSGDHEVRDIGPDRRGDDVTMFYSDASADDTFDWRLEWWDVSPTVIAPT
jgi:hypothetical protein